MSEVVPTDELFKEGIPSPLTDDGNPIGRIEDDAEYPDEIGHIWLRGTWINVAKARELRDWLNKVIP